jgi:hypothetical protein
MSRRSRSHKLSGKMTRNQRTDSAYRGMKVPIHEEDLYSSDANDEAAATTFAALKARNIYKR